LFFTAGGFSVKYPQKSKFNFCVLSVLCLEGFSFLRLPFQGGYVCVGGVVHPEAVTLEGKINRDADMRVVTAWK
jgi:hypothetical protein